MIEDELSHKVELGEVYIADVPYFIINRSLFMTFLEDLKVGTHRETAPECKKE
jgi:hypothetical protein